MTINEGVSGEPLSVASEIDALAHEIRGMAFPAAMAGNVTLADMFKRWSNRLEAVMLSVERTQESETADQRTDAAFTQLVAMKPDFEDIDLAERRPRPKYRFPAETKERTPMQAPKALRGAEPDPGVCPTCGGSKAIAADECRRCGREKRVAILKSEAQETRVDDPQREALKHFADTGNWVAAIAPMGDTVSGWCGPGNPWELARVALKSEAQ